MGIALLLLSVSTFLIIVIRMLKNPYRLSNGFLMGIFLGFVVSGLLYLHITYPNTIIRILLILVLVAILPFMIFGVYLIVAYLILNSIQMFRRESRTLGNSLSLLLVVAIIGQGMLGIIMNTQEVPGYIKTLADLFVVIESYFVLSVICFLMINFAVNHWPIKKDKDYIVVLGSGLINGDQVPPLLRGRIDRAIAFYYKQMVRGKVSVLVFSGGQGQNETISEGKAMAQYAISTGVDETDILIENGSRNTEENLTFSHQLMEERSPDGYDSVFVTSAYHVLRAGMIAQELGYSMRGLGSRVAAYFVPNALIREYIAITVIRRRSHLIMIGLIVWSFVIIVVLDLVLKYYNLVG